MTTLPPDGKPVPPATPMPASPAPAVPAPAPAAGADGEIGGPQGAEPARYGDWERNGRCSDF